MKNYLSFLICICIFFNLKIHANQCQDLDLKHIDFQTKALPGVSVEPARKEVFINWTKDVLKQLESPSYTGKLTLELSARGNTADFKHRCALESDKRHLRATAGIEGDYSTSSHVPREALGMYTHEMGHYFQESYYHNKVHRIMYTLEYDYRMQQNLPYIKHPYWEFFADMFAITVFKDPTIMHRSVDVMNQGQIPTIGNRDSSKMDPVRRSALFHWTEAEINKLEAWELYAVLGPTRTHLWFRHMKDKNYNPRAFLETLMDGIGEHIQGRIEAKQFNALDPMEFNAQMIQIFDRKIKDNHQQIYLP